MKQSEFNRQLKAAREKERSCRYSAKGRDDGIPILICRNKRNEVSYNDYCRYDTERCEPKGGG